MATIRSQMVLNDGMSAVLRKITSALDITLHSFEQVQRASGQSINSDLIERARSQLVGANAQLDEMAENYRRAAQQQENLNRGIRNGTTAADGMLGKVKGIVTTLAAGVGLQRIISLSDTVASGTARLTLLVDDGGSVAALERTIMASAMRSRAAYTTTLQTVSKLGLTAGDAFNGMDEVVAFTELVNKNFVIGGAAAQEQASGMYQLTQAMSSGRLQGDEYRSIIENAPLLANAIEDYMRNVQGAEGSMKDWASEGLLTAGVIKAALFSTADEVEERFSRMPLTWGQVWTQAGNIAIQVFQPVLTAINWLANNIAIIGPLVLGVGAAFLIFQVAAHWTQIAAIATAAYHFVVNLLSIGFGVLTGSTAAASAAVFTFNSALLASPITWIIMLIVILIGLLYGVVAVINKVTGSSISATELICGAVAVAGAFIGNLAIGTLNGIIQAVWAIFVMPFLGIIEWVLNVCNGGFDSFGGAVANLIGQIISWFLSLGKVVTTIIDAIFGTDWTAGLSSLQESVTAWGKTENAITLDRNAPQIDYRFEYGDAWAAGKDFGAGIDEKIGSMFNMGDDPSTAFDFAGMAADAGAIADNTGAAADALTMSNEQLEYLRDIAERDAINRFTTAEVKIDMTGMTNRIDGGADLDGVISTLTDGFTEALLTAAEGVHP